VRIRSPITVNVLAATICTDLFPILKKLGTSAKNVVDLN